MLLTSVKFLAYYLTRSNAVLSDAFESIINVLASGFAFYSIRISAQPKDSNHPYGHGKIEFFSAGFEGALIIIASAAIIYLGISRLLHPVPLENLSGGAALVGLTALANGALGYYLIREGRKLNSLALTADGKHLVSDFISTLVLLGSIALILVTGKQWIDAVASLVFGGLIALSGLRLVRKSVAGLMDETDPAILEGVARTIRTHRKDHWVDVHNMRVQQYGPDLHIDCHLTLPFYWSLQQSHDAVIDFENVLKASHAGETEVFEHTDHCLQACCRSCRLQNCGARRHSSVADLRWDAASLAKNEKLYRNLTVSKKKQITSRFHF